MLQEVQYKAQKRPRGKRLVRVLDKLGNVVLPVATYKDLEQQLGLTKNDIKKVSLVLAGERPSVKGFCFMNLGFLVEG